MVLSRTPLGETSAFITLLTPGLGLVRARAQSVRRPGAKLAAALTTFAESSLVLVRGRESWRIAGAVLEENWFLRMQYTARRTRASRVSGLVLRLVAGEAHDPGLCVLRALGFDAGDLPGGNAAFTPPALAEIQKNRTGYIARINDGIAASGL